VYSLFRANINWGYYLGAVVFIRLIFPQLSWVSYTALMISLYQFMLFFYSLGSILPFRYLLGSFMCLQMFVGPALAYNGLDEFQRGFLKMQIPENQYFAYVIPAVVMFLFGLHARAGKLKGEFVDIDSVRKFTALNPNLPYIFIAIGFVSSIIAEYFGSDLGFVFTLLAGFKFIGVFMLVLVDKQLKPLYLLLVFGSVILSSIGSAMFHDLLIWILFLGAIFSLKYKPSVNKKAIFVLGFTIMALFIQLVKGDYRDATWKEGEEGGLETFQKTIETKNEKNDLVSWEKLGESNVRINQGFIITNIMRNVPEVEPFSEGEELKQILEAAILPRILAPDKLNAGDREFFMKWAGFRIAQGTSMGLSSVGDAYINFGVLGGAIFMFLYGMLFSEVLNGFERYNKFYPILWLFPALVFYYPIRPDCELQTILGHLFKSVFLVFVVIQIWKYKFRLADHAE
jgi:hypothetical protein